MADVVVKVLFDATNATRDMRAFADQSVAGNKAVSDASKAAATATLEQARVEKTLADASLQTARAQEANAKAGLSVERANRAAAQTALTATQTLKAQTDTVTANTAAQEKNEAAARRAAAARDRALVAADNRQNRDESWAIRDQRSQTEGRRGLAGSAAESATVGGAVLLGGLAAAGVEAARFDSMMIQMRNNTQMTDQEFEVFRAHILKVGQDTGASMDQLGQAVMRAKNHGFDLAESLKIVDAATKSALATGADIGDTANVLSQTMHIFHLNADQATEAMNTLHQAQLQGNTTMEEFVSNFGLAEAVTSKYGLTLQDTAAITATMTENGLNMAEAGTQIRDVMQHLTNASPKATAEIQRLSKATGVDLVGDIERLKNGTGSLTQTMIDLNAATGGHAVEINKIIPAQRGAFGAMALTGKAADDLRKNFGQLGDTMSGKLDPSTEGFKRQQETLNAEMGRLENTLIVLATKIGTDVVPVLDTMAKHVTSAVDAFDKLDKGTQDTIVQLGLGTGAILLVGGTAVNAGLKITGLLGNLRDLGIGTKGVTTAMTDAAGAETAVGTAGVATFAMGGVLALAIGAFAAYVIYWWNQIHQAQDDAAASAQAYGDKLARMQKEGGQQGLLGTQQQIINGPGGVEDVKAQIALVQSMHPTGGILDRSQDSRVTQDWSGQTKDAVLDELYARMGALQHDLGNVTSALHATTATGAGAAHRVLTGGGATGDAVAAAALDAHFHGSAEKYREYCQRLVKETVDTVTHRYDRYFAGSASETMHNFQRAGIGHAYSPGEALAPGSMLYNDQWGRHNGRTDGHAMLVGPGGQIVDNVGSGLAKPGQRLIQWVVPLGAPAAGDGVNRGGSGGASSPATPEEQQRLHEEYVTATKGKYAGERTEAWDKYQKDKLVNAAQAHAVYVARLKEIQSEEQKDLAEHNAKIETAEQKRLQKHQEFYASILKVASEAQARLLRGEDAYTAQTIAEDTKRQEAIKRGAELKIKALETGEATAEIGETGIEGQQRKLNVQQQIADLKNRIAAADLQIAKNDKTADQAEAAQNYALALADVNAELAQQKAQTAQDRTKQASDDLSTTVAWQANQSAARSAALANTPEGQSARISGIGGNLIPMAAPPLSLSLSTYVSGADGVYKLTGVQTSVGQGGTLGVSPLSGPSAPLTTTAAGALDAGDAGNRSRPGRRGVTGSVGGYDFWGGLQQEASQASGQLVEGLLSGKGSKAAIRSFWKDVEQIGVNAVSQTMTTITSNALSGLMGGGGKNPFGGIASLFKGAKGDLLAGAAGIYGAAAALGAFGKKKQSHSILGGLLGFAAGSLLPGIGNLEGAEFGSALGGMFADGGRPPLGMASIVGERGPELFVPDGPGTVVPLDRGFSTSAPRGFSMDTGGSRGASARPIHVEQNIHNPTYSSDVDTDRDHERLARALDVAFTLA